ncbi:glycoside hydrolase family 97 protein [Candidatus Saccharibacteria bacterium]|nr:glycoside hydrolase family 97 protein [Candidatus Saccharibacteria bacterium]
MKRWGLKNSETEKSIISPDGQIKFELDIKNHQIFYHIFKKDQEIVKNSKLDLDIADYKKTNLKLISFRSFRHDETVEMLWGEDQFIDNTYVEGEFVFEKFTIRVRAFNDAVAFKYELTGDENVTIKNELTEFNVDLDSTCWQIPAYRPDRYEYNYEAAKVYDLKESVHTPLTIRIPSGIYLSVHEAALYDYGSTTIKLDENNILSTDVTPLSDGAKAYVTLPWNTPWRLIMIADSAIDLTKNRVMYVLNEPPKEDFSWVKTLKFIGIWWAMYVGEWTWAPGERHGATTAHAKEYINAAVELGIKGVLIEGWNDGWEGNWLENGVNNKFTTSTPDFNLEEVASYAKAKNIELVGHHETVGFVDNYENQIEDAYNYYAANGVHYIKTGYAGSMITINGKKEYHHSQAGVNHYQKTVELAAKKQIMLDIHEPIKGTGIERTWPNLLTREGARGQEYEGGALRPSHPCYLPYTRLLAGGMDYTNGIFDIENSVKRISTTLARQVAYFVTIYSGMTMAADRPFIYKEKFPELFEFVKVVPTNFEKTVPICGEVGDFYVVARKDRDSKDWYLGGVTDQDGRSVKVKLDFLDAGMYRAYMYIDGKDAHFRDNPYSIEISKKRVKKSDILDIYMAPGGGFAIRLEKI